MSKYGKYTRRDADQEIFKPKEDTRYWERGTHKLMIKCPKCGETAFVRESWSTFTCFKCYNIITREQHIQYKRDYIEADISYFLYAYGNMNYLSLLERYPNIRVSKYEWGTMTPEQRAHCVLNWLTGKDYIDISKPKDMLTKDWWDSLSKEHRSAFLKNFYMNTKYTDKWDSLPRHVRDALVIVSIC